MSILSVVESFVRGLRLSFTITCRAVVGGSLHHLFKLDVRLSSGKNLAHLDDIILQEMFVQRMSDLQVADERERGDFFTTIKDFG